MIRVRKLTQHGIVASRLEELEKAAENWIQHRLCVRNIKIERNEIATEMELGIVVKRTAAIILQSMFERPFNDVAQSIKIEVKIVGNTIIETKIVIVNRAFVNHANAEGDDFCLLSPNEKPGPFRHSLTKAAKILFGQPLEFEGRTFMNLQIERVNLVDIGSDIVDHLEMNGRGAFCLSEFSAQILSRRFA